ncbi:uncharacterized protein [Gossypium hirsutum]|uniref:Uncharacterized protein isoform X5 n=1 Tax=Gossypium hirsutum TaxID=3635 RepID=A0ABM2Z0P1_GOSHI|nr:uncharacterized protein LOC107897734 isoform X5 [Gossypium hirsutum]
MTNQASFTIFIFLPLNLLIYAAVVFAALKLASRHCRLQLPLSASSSGLRHLTNCKYYWTYRQVCCLPKRLKKLRLDLLCTWSAGICYCFLFLFGLFDCFLHLELSILYSLNHYFGSPAIGLGILKSKSPTLSKPSLFGTILVELRNGMYRTTLFVGVMDPLDLYNFG